MRFYMEVQYIQTTNQSIATMNKMKARGLEFHLFLLFAFHLPPVPSTPPKKLKGAAEHHWKPPFQSNLTILQLSKQRWRVSNHFPEATEVASSRIRTRTSVLLSNPAVLRVGTTQFSTELFSVSCQLFLESFLSSFDSKLGFSSARLLTRQWLGKEMPPGKFLMTHCAKTRVCKCGAPVSHFHGSTTSAINRPLLLAKQRENPWVKL